MTNGSVFSLTQTKPPGIGNLDVGIRAEADDHRSRQKRQREKNPRHLRHLPGKGKNTGADHDAGTQHDGSREGEAAFLVAGGSVLPPAHSTS